MTQAAISPDPRYHQGMRCVVLGVASLAIVAGAARAARADTFGGFSGFDKPYLVNQDRVCTPLPIANGAAAGAPHCEQLAADAIAKLSIKPPQVQSGVHAAFAATAAGRTLSVTRKTGEPVVQWSASDPIGQVVDVYATELGDRVAVAYTSRRAGRELTDVVAFDLGIAGATAPDHGSPTAPTGTNPVAPVTPVAPVAPAPPDDPRLAASLKAARGAPSARTWAAVLAIEPNHGEALVRTAELAARAKKPADALAALHTLAGSPRADAIEWRVEARFSPAFAALRADPAFRAAVGLDNPKPGTYERFMGFGGQWEQAGTSCDKPEVRLTALRDRTFKLRVKTACEGQVMDLPFHGTWQTAPGGDGVVLTLPNQGKQASTEDQTPCVFETHGDEEGLHCVLGKDIEFTVLPARR